MAIQATMEWRIRAGGNVDNGGGFDPQVSGAGTDYSDQDAAQLTLTDLATSGAGSTTLTSATGGFTSAMIGNVVRIKSGTNFDVGYYVVTGHTDTNTVTLDRSPTSAGAGSSGTGSLGGAFAHFESLAGTGNGGLNSPTITTPLAAGHTVWVRGAGTDDPTVVDHDWTGSGSGYWSSNPNGDTTDGRIYIKGYNGRPLIHADGLLWNTPVYWTLDHLKFKQNSGFTTQGLFGGSNETNNSCAAIDVHIDQNGVDRVCLCCALMVKVVVTNSGTKGGGSQTALKPQHYGFIMYGCVVKESRGVGFGATVNSMGVWSDCIAMDCGASGFHIDGTSTSWCMHILNCTSYSNGGDGFRFETADEMANMIVRNCLAVDNGGYGFNCTVGATALNDRRIRDIWDHNAGYNNTSGLYNNVSAGDNDVTLTADPFTDGANGDFSLNDTSGGGADLKEAGFPGVFNGISTTGYRDIGAVETLSPVPWRPRQRT